jgi:hypothetical protein
MATGNSDEVRCLKNLEALIGMNVLRECLLLLDGPGQHFILGF